MLLNKPTIKAALKSAAEKMAMSDDAATAALGKYLSVIDFAGVNPHHSLIALAAMEMMVLRLTPEQINAVSDVLALKTHIGARAFLKIGDRDYELSPGRSAAASTLQSAMEFRDQAEQKLKDAMACLLAATYLRVDVKGGAQ